MILFFVLLHGVTWCLLMFYMHVRLICASIKFTYLLLLTASWLNLPHLPILPPTVTAKQRVVTIPGNQPEEGTDGYGGKDFEKREFLRRAWKTSKSLVTHLTAITAVDLLVIICDASRLVT